MTTSTTSGRRISFRLAIETFLKERLDAKLDKLADDDPKRAALIAQHHPATWLDDAARRVTQIQAVTHTLKPLHPDARGTNLHVRPEALPSHAEIGSHVLGSEFADDVVGNAAALDVYKFLKIDIEGRSFLRWLLDNDSDLVAALDDDGTKASALAEAFKGLIQPRESIAASHVLAKQLYWLADEDTINDSHYRLLAPLYASSLAHAIFHRLNEDRFGDDGKQAREARRKGAEHPVGFREYPNLAVQKFGGTKPQNISQLNSERAGNNHLLSSLPPRWKSRTLVAPFHSESVFPRFGRRSDVRDAAADFLNFLLTDPEPNMRTRNTVDRHVDGLIDQLVLFAAEMQGGLPGNWSTDAACELAGEERLWLDPRRCESDEEFRGNWLTMDWPDQIGKRFGNWLNAQLEGRLPVGENEARQWRRELLVDESDEGWAWQLQKLRQQQDAPTYIPTRGAVP